MSGRPENAARSYRVVTSDGAALHAEVSGAPDAAVTVVLVHGWTQDHRTWDRVVDELPSGVRRVRYDLRGHGASEAAGPGTATIDRLADDLADVLAELVPDGRLVLAGHSMGGMTLMALAERHPTLVDERVDGLALVATSSGDMSRVTLGLPGALGRRAAATERRLATAL
ncbi:alpha/beta fold hydrolase, partial [Saccharomonospora halophila]|uniref:alpha/beta fold hydrolase n=1 Tax=Saccharomonospora halophila TaxID=129922 RepID=UPI0012F752D8